MITYFFKRILLLVPILLGVSLLTFSIIELIPGDPALAILGPMATEENIAEIREELNLGDPIYVRYVTWLSAAVTGDFGRSISLERPVWDEVMERMTATLILAGFAFALCLIVGIGVGTLLAFYKGSFAEKMISTLIIAGVSTPSFWLGLILVLIFSVFLQWLPASGMVAVTRDNASIMDLLRHLILPSITLAVVASSLVARVMRAKMIEILEEDFIRTAKAKGISTTRLLFRHAIPNGLVPIIPILGLQAGYLLGGAVYVETIFQWPGIGRMLVQAIQARDIILVQGGVLVVAIAYVLINLVADLIQMMLDPRIRTQ